MFLQHIINQALLLLRYALIYLCFQMEINLKDQIVVLDEAHNVEDSARDAASLTLTAVDLQNTLDDLDRLGNEKIINSFVITAFGWAISG